MRRNADEYMLTFKFLCFWLNSALIPRGISSPGLYGFGYIISCVISKFSVSTAAGVCVGVSVNTAVGVFVGVLGNTFVGVREAVGVSVNVSAGVRVDDGVPVNVFVGSGTPIAAVLLVTSPLFTAHAPAASMPPALPWNVTTPEASALYVQVNAAVPSAGMETIEDGLVSTKTPPVPAITRLEAITLSAAPFPVFVTIIMTVMVSPAFTVFGATIIWAVRQAPDVAVCVGVFTGVSVIAGVPVKVRVRARLGVIVAVIVAVSMLVIVTVGVAVDAGVYVSVFAIVAVYVNVTVSVCVAVNVLELVHVRVIVGVFVDVGGVPANVCDMVGDAVFDPVTVNVPVAVRVNEGVAVNVRVAVNVGLKYGVLVRVPVDVKVF
jgi:hypothetical protein